MKPKPKIKLILDSGAYSAFTQQSPINIDTYAKFAIANLDHFVHAVNMDWIGPASPEEAAIKSMANFIYLKENYGLLSMPVFHCNEPLRFLDQMLDLCDYVGLSSSMSSLQEGFLWYDLVWAHITDAKGYPIARFHAFGDAAPQALLSYPWYSADSTTWTIAAGLSGKIFIGGKYVQFRTKMERDVNSVNKDDTGNKREVWENEFRERGLNPDICMNKQCRESDIMLVRMFMCAAYFLELQEKTRSKISYDGPVSPFYPKKNIVGGKPVINPVNLHYVITSSTATRALAIIYLLKIDLLLISFYYVEPKQWENLILPFIYDPDETVRTHKGLQRQVEIMSEFMLKTPDFLAMLARIGPFLSTEEDRLKELKQNRPRKSEKTGYDATIQQ